MALTSRRCNTEDETLNLAGCQRRRALFLLWLFLRGRVDYFVVRLTSVIQSLYSISFKNGSDLLIFLFFSAGWKRLVIDLYLIFWFFFLHLLYRVNHSLFYFFIRFFIFFSHSRFSFLLFLGVLILRVSCAVRWEPHGLCHLSSLFIHLAFWLPCQPCKVVARNRVTSLFHLLIYLSVLFVCLLFFFPTTRPVLLFILAFFTLLLQPAEPSVSLSHRRLLSKESKNRKRKKQRKRRNEEDWRKEQAERKKEKKKR